MEGLWYDQKAWSVKVLLKMRALGLCVSLRPTLKSESVNNFERECLKEILSNC